MAQRKTSAADNKSQLKRQVEILGLSLAPGAKYEASDFHEMFNYHEAQLQRDLAAIRSMGIDIHSTKKKIGLTGTTKPEVLHEIIVQYLGYCYSSDSYDRATSLLVKKQKEKALYYVVAFQRAIDSGTKVEIDYEKERGKVDEKRVLCPLMLFQADHEWRVLAINEGVKKQYILQKIRNLRMLEERFEKPKRDELRRLFENMWSGWLGEAKYKIKIRFSPLWATRLDHRVFTENQVYTVQSDGTALLEAGVPNLDEVASWVVSRGEGVTVLEPPELRELVIKLARGALKNYEG